MTYAWFHGFNVFPLLGSSAIDSSPVKPAPSSDWLAESSDAEETLVNSSSGSEADNSEPAPTFFRSFIFSPEVPIRLDYQGKRVDMEQVGDVTSVTIISHLHTAQKCLREPLVENKNCTFCFGCSLFTLLKNTNARLDSQEIENW